MISPVSRFRSCIIEVTFGKRYLSVGGRICISPPACNCWVDTHIFLAVHRLPPSLVVTSLAEIFLLDTFQAGFFFFFPSSTPGSRGLRDRCHTRLRSSSRPITKQAETLEYFKTILNGGKQEPLSFSSCGMQVKKSSSSCKIKQWL